MSVNGLNEDLDYLDADDYDPIDHLNEIFTHPSILSSVGRTYEVLTSYQDDLEDEIDLLEEAQNRANAECLARMEASKAELAELFKRIDGVRERALRTERNITEMTADIKQLDNTKKNLTLSMTALKRLQMLTTAYEQLRALIKTKQYRECAQLLQAVIQLMAYFKSYRSIEQIAALNRNVSELQRELLEQVCENFEIIFAKEEVLQKQGLLHESCLVVDALGDAARSRLITWYCNTELRQYRTIFRSDQEAGSLDNIDRRYAWFRKTMKTYDEEHAAIFLQHWHVGEILAHVFAEGTREDFKAILSRSTRGGQTLDVRLLLACLQQTLDFEHSLERRFNNTSRTSTDTTTSATEPTNQLVSISEAFEPYLELWIDQQDKELARLMSEYKSRPTRPPDEEFNAEHVIPSSTELIKFYQLSFNQCAKLSTGQPLLDLTRVFGKYLEQYSQQVLLFYISEKPSGSTPSRVPTIEDIILTLNTADYCYNTSNQLEEKIKSRIDDQYRVQVDLQSQADAFMGIASAAVRGLVRRVEVDLEPSWREMRNTNFGRIEVCENNSSYIPGLQRKIKDRTSSILQSLHKQQYARAFADNLVELLSNTYLANIGQCRPISEAGAEQMLLDTHEIKRTLSQILPGNPPPAAFLKRVNAAMGKIEPLLKTLQVNPSPPEALVQAYLVHIADLSDNNFKKILEMKGIKNRSEYAQLVELYQMHKLSPRYQGSLVERSPVLSSLNGVPSGNPSQTSNTPSGGAAALQNLSALGNSAAASLSTANLPGNINMKFADGIGSALMDRFSSATPGLGAPSPREDAQSPPPSSLNIPNLTVTPAVVENVNGDGDGDTGTKLNENLKNIGKFFKRDLGSFGGIGRFGGSKSASPAPPEDRT
ncbi:Vacuolar protein sorting-associated protein 53 [Lithohypha guttulata]|nr:Vacuolar protein sorting-associated protein 53 [Lithohypha guttulata]